MASFMAMVYATLKKEGIDTNGMSPSDAVEKFKELSKSSKQKDNEPSLDGLASVNREIKQINARTKEMEELYKINSMSKSPGVRLGPEKRKEIVAEYKDLLYRGDDLSSKRLAYRYGFDGDVEAMHKSFEDRQERSQKDDAEKKQKDREEINKREYLNNPDLQGKFNNKTKGKILYEINNQIETGIKSGGGVYDNENVYTKNLVEDLESEINNIFKDDGVVDTSRRSEATYITLKDKNNEGNNLHIRIGSHFKPGVSGSADIHLDYRNYKNIKDLRKDLKIIKDALKE